MINYFLALNILFNSIDKSDLQIKLESISSLNALNMINAFDLLSFTWNPFFNNAAMDGYAFNIFKIKYNFNDINNKFFVIDVLKAGDLNNSYNFDGDYIIEIMTGSRLPANFNSVIKIEEFTLDYNNPFELILKRYLSLHENIRLRGEDFGFGEFIIKKGQIISCSDIMAASTFGISEIAVLKTIKVFLICTGSEIIDSFNVDIDKVGVKNSIAYYFISFFKNIGVDLVYLGISCDIKNFFKKKIYDILSCDEKHIIITTGAVSKGKADFIPSFLVELGANIFFHGVAIKPGKPILFAKYGFNYFFCLPGNPISSVIGLRFFIYPFFQYLNGFFLDKPLKAVLENDYFFNNKYDLFLKAFTYFYNSIFYVKIIKDQESFKIKSFVKSNSFVFLKMNDRVVKGDILNVYFHQPYNLIKDYDYYKY